MDIAIQKQFYNNCELRPSKPIAPGNAFYFPFDERGLRGPDCIQRLAYSVNQSNQHTCQLFTGLLGSGKSTELQRLRGMLQQRSNRVVLADVELEGWCDYSQPLHFGDILWAVCFALHHQLASDHALKEWFSGITDRFIKILQTEISLEKVDVGLKAGGVDLGGLEFKLKSEPDFRRKLNDQLMSLPAAMKRASHEFVGEVRKGLLHNRQQRLIVILDGLEKFAQGFVERQRHEDHVREVFLNRAELLRIPCDVIYTIPPFMAQHGPELRALYSEPLGFLPMVRVVNRKGKPDSAGVAGMVEAFSRRVTLDTAFSKPRDSAEQMVLASGGYFRDLLLLMRECLKRCPSDATSKITPTIVDGSVAVLRDEYRRSLLEEHRQPLRAAWTTGDPILSKDSRNVFGDLLRSHLLLRYHNDSEWYAPHPLVQEFLPSKKSTSAKRRKSGPKKSRRRTRPT